MVRPKSLAPAAFCLTPVIPAGEGNSYGHPAPETLERLDARPIFRTDLHGDVQITTDGHKLWIETQRE